MPAKKPATVFVCIRENDEGQPVVKDAWHSGGRINPGDVVEVSVEDAEVLVEEKRQCMIVDDPATVVYDDDDSGDDGAEQ